MTDMKLVYIASPYAGDIEYNTKMAIAYCRYAADCGVIPLAPHLLLPRFLCESNPAERELGIKMGLKLLALCSELWCSATGYPRVCGVKLRKLKGSGLKSSIKIQIKFRE